MKVTNGLNRFQVAIQQHLQHPEPEIDPRNSFSLIYCTNMFAIWLQIFLANLLQILLLSGELHAAMQSNAAIRISYRYNLSSMFLSTLILVSSK